MPSMGELLLSLVISSIGLSYFVYGKRQTLVVPRLCGLALMVYPYFVENIWALLGIGLLFMGIPFVIKE